MRPDQVLVCVDYFFDERQHDMLRPYLPPGALLIVGNWRNRTSCLLRLVDVIAREGDGLVVDSDVVLAGEFLEIEGGWRSLCITWLRLLGAIEEW